MSRVCRSCGSTETERTKGGRCKPCYNAACRASKARRWEAHKAESRAWGKRNSARLTENKRRKRHQDPVYAAAVAERAARINRAWHEANPGGRSAYQAARRALKAQAEGRYTQQEFVDLCHHYGDRCLACGDEEAALTADHVVPLSKKGSNGIENIQPLCQSCNSKKGTRVIDYRPDRRSLAA